MSFFNECYYILRNSNKDMLVINSNNGIVYDYLTKSEVSSSSNSLTNSQIDFTNYYFDIDFEDTIYGIFNDTSINIVKFNNFNNRFYCLNKIEYDYKNFNIDFPYIHFVGDDIHISYYLTSKSSTTTVLFHHYRHDNKWTESKIDFINTPVLDNFIVFFNQDTPTIFYLKDYNGFPQIFTSTFNISMSNWSTPLQITDSSTSKIYLSVIKDYLNFYHITFSESNENGYSVKYINGYLNSNSFEITLSKYITYPSDCVFPTLIKHGKTIYLMWVEHKLLYTSFSKDLGLSWNEFIQDEFGMTSKFIRSYFKSNYANDFDYNCNTLFISKDDISILGFFNK